MRARKLIPLAIVAVVAIVVAALAGLASSGSSDAAAKVYKAGLVSDVDGSTTGRSTSRPSTVCAARSASWASRAALSSRGRRATTSRISRRSRGSATTSRSRSASCWPMRRTRSRRASGTRSSRSSTTRCSAAVHEEQERAGPDVRDEREQLHDRLSLGAHGESAWPQGDQRGRRHQAADGGHLHRRATVRAPTVVPGRVLIGYSQDFVAQDKCKEIALNQIAQGSRVSSRSPAAAVSAPSTQPRSAASGASVWTRTRRTSVGTSSRARSRVDQAVFLTVKAVKEGTYRGRHRRRLQPEERRRRHRPHRCTGTEEVHRRMNISGP